jgi:hypothetical protein
MAVDTRNEYRCDRCCKRERDTNLPLDWTKVVLDTHGRHGTTTTKAYDLCPSCLYVVDEVLRRLSVTQDDIRNADKAHTGEETDG